MSQSYTPDCFATGHNYDTDMGNIENNCKAFASSFSGSSAPSSPETGRLWFNTASGHEGLRVRNSGNTAWHKVLTGTAATKLWVYSNAAVEGWVIDSSVTDRVLALKGGSGHYSANGGTTAGWGWSAMDSFFDQIDTHTHSGGSHTHKWYESVNDNLTSDSSFSSGGGSKSLTADPSEDKSNTSRAIWAMGSAGVDDLSYAEPICDLWTNASSVSVSASTGISAPADPRPAAAIGTLQYPDLT